MKPKERCVRKKTRWEKDGRGGSASGGRWGTWEEKGRFVKIPQLIRGKRGSSGRLGAAKQQSVKHFEGQRGC